MKKTLLALAVALSLTACDDHYHGDYGYHHSTYSHAYYPPVVHVYHQPVIVHHYAGYHTIFHSAYHAPHVVHVYHH